MLRPARVLVHVALLAVFLASCYRDIGRPSTGPAQQQASSSRAAHPTPAADNKAVADTQAARILAESLTASVREVRASLMRIDTTLGKPKGLVEQYLPIASAGIAILSIIVGVIMWGRTQVVTQNAKRADIVLEFHSRFSKLMNEWNTKKDEREKTLRCYEQFWFVNHQQFFAWRVGLIADPTFTFWMTRRRKEFLNGRLTNIEQNATSANPPTGEMSFEFAWKALRDQYEETDFQPFMDEILLVDPTNASRFKYPIKDVLEKHCQS